MSLIKKIRLHRKKRLLKKKAPIEYSAICLGDISYQVIESEVNKFIKTADEETIDLLLEDPKRGLIIAMRQRETYREALKAYKKSGYNKAVFDEIVREWTRYTPHFQTLLDYPEINANNTRFVKLYPNFNRKLRQDTIDSILRIDKMIEGHHKEFEEILTKIPEPEQNIRKYCYRLYRELLTNPDKFERITI